MSYERRVEIQRKQNRITEERHKAAKRRAKNSGQDTRLPVVPEEGPSLWLRMFALVTGKAADWTCGKCSTRTTLKQLSKRQNRCPKCGEKAPKDASEKKA